MNRHSRRAHKAANPGAVHELVAATALEFAGHAYEVLAGGNNDWYKANPSHRKWVLARWREFVPAAREKLVDLLTDNTIDDAVKEKIHTALMLDAGLNPPVVHAQQASMALH